MYLHKFDFAINLDVKQATSPFLDLVDGVQKIIFRYLSQNEIKWPKNQFFSYRSGSWGIFPVFGGLK